MQQSEHSLSRSVAALFFHFTCTVLSSHLCASEDGVFCNTLHIMDVKQSGEDFSFDQLQTLNGQWQTPFTAIIVGPSGCGKSTFVANLIRNQQNLISKNFDYVYIFIGTRKEDNPLFCELAEDKTLSHPLTIFSLAELYPNQKLADTQFVKDFDTLISGHHKAGQMGAVIFDDLMTELADCNLLSNLFSRVSSHQKVSIIHITQNLFHQGKKKTDNVTIFRNTKKLVVFRSPIDNTVLSTIAQRINPGQKSSAKLHSMLKYIVQKYRYVVISGDFSTPSELQFCTDIFANQPYPHQTTFEL